MEINFKSLRLPDQELIKIRKELYHSSAPGFYVFKKFIDAEFLKHMVDFWTNENFEKSDFSTLTQIDKKNQFYMGCPNYFYPTKYGKAYYQYFWNSPVDEATMSVSFAIQQLRNNLQSYNNYHEFFPLSGNSCSYRVVFTFNGDKVVAPHTDWLEPVELFKPERLQATLILTKKGVDYEGTGMWMESNDKKTKYIFDENLQVEPGDLVVWRYNNLHAVENVKTPEGKKGFIRMIFPPEFIFNRTKEQILKDFSGKELLNEIKQRAKNKFLK